MATPHPSTASLRSGCHLPLKVKALSNIIAKKRREQAPALRWTHNVCTNLINVGTGVLDGPEKQWIMNDEKWIMNNFGWFCFAKSSFHFQFSTFHFQFNSFPQFSSLKRGAGGKAFFQEIFLPRDKTNQNKKTKTTSGEIYDKGKQERGERGVKAL